VRLTLIQQAQIKKALEEVYPQATRVILFGSRVDDQAKGGDVDLLLEFAEPVENPAWVSAQFGAKVSRAMFGRKVDVLLSAPNLPHLPIHEVAMSQGIIL
jgi:predicted nucleotidyltransferase